jgi:hypothetical protein
VVGNNEMGLAVTKETSEDNRINTITRLLPAAKVTLVVCAVFLEFRKSTLSLLTQVILVVVAAIPSLVGPSLSRLLGLGLISRTQ